MSPGFSNLIYTHTPYTAGDLTDDFMGRRRTWDGVVIQDLGRSDEYRGHYYRVYTSARDPHTKAWSIWCRPEDYLGSVMPKGEPVYRFTGTTWDMKAVPSTVVPGWWNWVGYGALWLLFVFYMTHISHDEATAFIWVVLSLPFAIAPFWLWFYRIEPVRGTKVFLVWLAIHYLLRERHARDRAEYDAQVRLSEQWRNANEGQWPDTPNYRVAERPKPPRLW
jgi:hypothetical protein